MTSRVAPFIVGVIVSQAGYVYLSDQLVTSRNRLMRQHLGSSQTYQPELQASVAEHIRSLMQAAGFGGRGSLDMDDSKDGTNDSPYSFLSRRSTEDHSMVVNMRKSWNGAVISASNSLVGVFYGGGDERKDSPSQKVETSSEDNASRKSAASA